MGVVRAWRVTPYPRPPYTNARAFVLRVSPYPHTPPGVSIMYLRACVLRGHPRATRKHAPTHASRMRVREAVLSLPKPLSPRALVLPCRTPSRPVSAPLSASQPKRSTVLGGAAASGHEKAPGTMRAPGA
jgi:hypothetical protein